MTRQPAKISVQGLWKVFGPQPERILRSEWRDKPRAEVQKETGHVIALRDVSFDVADGETFVVMGLSGSGKSTLVRCLLRLIEPTSGRVLVDGEDILRYTGRRLIQFRRSRAGMVFQRFALLPHRTVLANVAFPLETQGLSRRRRLARAMEALCTVGLEGWEHSMPHELSGGMQQRVGLARALAANPEILLMDEPFSALDPLIRREMQAELARLQKALKKTIVFITHDLDEALKLGDRIAIMRDGAFIQVGTPSEIVSSPSDDYVAEFTRDVRKGAVLHVSSVMAAPGVRVREELSPDEALRALREANATVAFVVGEDDLLRGAIAVEAAAAAARDGVLSLGMLAEQVPLVVSADSTLEALLQQMAVYDWRMEVLPVVDAEGHLVGQVDRALVGALAADTRAKEPAKEG